MRSYLAFAAVLFISAAHAEPFVSEAAVGTAYTVSVESSVTGGTGQVQFAISSPPAGYYMVTFTANFVPPASVSSSLGFSCVLLRDNVAFAQSTVLTTSTSGWDIGVNGGAPIEVKKGTKITATCGTLPSQAWAWGGRALEVTFVKLAAVTKLASSKIQPANNAGLKY